MDSVGAALGCELEFHSAHHEGNPRSGRVLSRKFCQWMGGDILVSSGAGKGSTLMITLRVAVVASASGKSDEKVQSSKRTSPFIQLYGYV